MTTHSPLIIDVAGYELTPADERRLLHPLVGGMILFGRNFQSRLQIQSLCQAVKKIRPDLLITVDHEGGRVQRFKTDGFTHLPAMGQLGEIWMKEPTGTKIHANTGALAAMNIATACGYVLASELRACGVDFSFTPVLDLNYGNSQVIGNRAFHSDPKVVSALAKSVMMGLLQAGIAHCAKHFPGHGFVGADSHTEMPVDKRSLTQILSTDAMPYFWLSSSLTSVMPAHVIYSKVDKKPAGFSSKWIQDILRGKLAFTGAIFSDDLSMAAARVLNGEQLSFAQAATQALNAGCDMVLVCNQSLKDGHELDAALDDMSDALAKGLWHPNEASEERRFSLMPTSSHLDWDSLMVSAPYMAALELLP